MNDKEKEIHEFCMNHKRSIKEVSDHIGCTYQKAITMLRSMMSRGLVDSYKSNIKTYYKAIGINLLQELLHPKDKILKRMKVKSTKVSMLNHRPNVSYGGSKGWTEVSRSYENTIYTGGE